MNLILLTVISIFLFVLLILIFLKYRKLNNRFKNVIDIDKKVDKQNSLLTKLKKQSENLEKEFTIKKEELSKDYSTKRDIYETLLKEIRIVEEDLENISYGLYKPHYDYNTSEEFKRKLEEVRNKQKELIKNEKATFCPIEWTVEGSKTKGKKMMKESSKLMLRAFNGECDAAVAKVSWNNVVNMEARIEKAFEAINKLGSTNQMSITNPYLKLKIEELHLEFELEEKIYQEKEEQRRIKEQMREEERALREIEKAQKEAEEEERRYQKALDKAKADLLKAKGSEFDELNQRIKELEEKLNLAHKEKERAISMAQLTKSGHVYIISNIGSFGEDVYKIGMTRRLEPMDRIKELGDASVPFDFDVHALIYSENAPELENKLHQKFEVRRVNLVNPRREFFRVSLDEIEEISKEIGLDFKLTKLAEAKEFRESQSILIAKSTKNEVKVISELERFPSNI